MCSFPLPCLGVSIVGAGSERCDVETDSRQGTAPQTGALEYAASKGSTVWNGRQSYTEQINETQGTPFRHHEKIHRPARELRSGGKTQRENYRTRTDCDGQKGMLGYCDRSRYGNAGKQTGRRCGRGLADDV